MARKPQPRRLAIALIVTAALWTGMTAAAAAAQTSQSIPAGATSQVTVPASNVLATCTPPAVFQPNPTKWSVSPSGVVLGNLPDAAAAPPAGHALSVSVPSYLAPGQTIVISWSGNTSCLSYNGSITLTVSGGIRTAAGRTAAAAGPAAATSRLTATRRRQHRQDRVRRDGDRRAASIGSSRAA